jgi:hypothetical protein
VRSQYCLRRRLPLLALLAEQKGTALMWMAQLAQAQVAQAVQAL